MERKYFPQLDYICIQVAMVQMPLPITTLCDYKITATEFSGVFSQVYKISLVFLGLKKIPKPFLQKSLPFLKNLEHPTKPN